MEDKSVHLEMMKMHAMYGIVQVYLNASQRMYNNVFIIMIFVTLFLIALWAMMNYSAKYQTAHVLANALWQQWHPEHDTEAVVNWHGDVMGEGIAEAEVNMHGESEEEETDDELIMIDEEEDDELLPLI